jgi:hypothetical protein
MADTKAATKVSPAADTKADTKVSPAAEIPRTLSGKAAAKAEELRAKAIDKAAKFGVSPLPSSVDVFNKFQEHTKRHPAMHKPKWASSAKLYYNTIPVHGKILKLIMLNEMEDKGSSFLERKWHGVKTTFHTMFHMDDMIKSLQVLEYLKEVAINCKQPLDFFNQTKHLTVGHYEAFRWDFMAEFGGKDNKPLCFAAEKKDLESGYKGDNSEDLDFAARQTAGESVHLFAIMVFLTMRPAEDSTEGKLLCGPPVSGAKAGNQGYEDWDNIAKTEVYAKEKPKSADTESYADWDPLWLKYDSGLILLIRKHLNQTKEANNQARDDLLMSWYTLLLSDTIAILRTRIDHANSTYTSILSAATTVVITAMNFVSGKITADSISYPSNSMTNSTLGNM